MSAMRLSHRVTSSGRHFGTPLGDGTMDADAAADAAGQEDEASARGDAAGCATASGHSGMMAAAPTSSAIRVFLIISYLQGPFADGWHFRSSPALLTFTAVRSSRSGPCR